MKRTLTLALATAFALTIANAANAADKGRGHDSFYIGVSGHGGNVGYNFGYSNGGHSSFGFSFINPRPHWYGTSHGHPWGHGYLHHPVIVRPPHWGNTGGWGHGGCGTGGHPHHYNTGGTYWNGHTGTSYLPGWHPPVYGYSPYTVR